MLNTKFFNAMDNNSVIINVGRGKTIVDEDLKLALQNKLLGAGLDVTRDEPINKNHWIYTDKTLSKKVLLTCHKMDKPSSFFMPAKIRNVTKNLDNLINNRPLENIVNK